MKNTPNGKKSIKIGAYIVPRLLIEKHEEFFVSRRASQNQTSKNLRVYK